MRKSLATLAVLTVASLSACGLGPVESGTVTNKHFEPYHVTQEERDVTEEECEWDTDTKRVNGKTKTTREYECEDVVVGTETVDVEHPDQWTLDLKNEDGDTGTVEVTEDEYNSVEVGEFFDAEAE